MVVVVVRGDCSVDTSYGVDGGTDSGCGGDKDREVMDDSVGVMTFR